MTTGDILAKIGIVGWLALAYRTKWASWPPLLDSEVLERLRVFDALGNSVGSLGHDLGLLFVERRGEILDIIRKTEDHHMCEIVSSFLIEPQNTSLDPQPSFHFLDEVIIAARQLPPHLYEHYKADLDAISKDLMHDLGIDPMSKNQAREALSYFLLHSLDEGDDREDPTETPRDPKSNGRETIS